MGEVIKVDYTMLTDKDKVRRNDTTVNRRLHAQKKGQGLKNLVLRTEV